MLLVVNMGMLCGAARGKVRGQTAGDCGVVIMSIKYHFGVELVPRVLVDDISSFPEWWGGKDLGSNFQNFFRKISELNVRKYPLSDLNCILHNFPRLLV